MPDSPTEPSTGGPYLPEMEYRVRTLKTNVAKLDQIATNIDARLSDITAELRALRADFRADVRMLLMIMMGGFGLILTAFLALLGAVGHAVHWW